MPNFFDHRSIDDKYNRLSTQTINHYPGPNKYRRLLLDKIEALKLLEKEYPHKKSIQHAFAVLDNSSTKNFKGLKVKIAQLQKAAREDSMEFSFIKSCISLLFLPIFLPLLILEIIAAIAAAYEFMILMQIALLATAISLTLAFLPPLMLLATIPAAVLVSHLLSEFFIDGLLEQIAYEISVSFNSLFYVQNEPLQQGLNEVIEVVKQTQYQCEDSGVKRLSRTIYQQLTNCFNNEDFDEEEQLNLAYG